jgi:hypothetical protein
MDKNNSYYYSEEEWTRLGCGPLPPERSRVVEVPVDNKEQKGYN